MSYVASYKDTGPGLRRGDVPLPVWRSFLEGVGLVLQEGT